MLQYWSHFRYTMIHKYYVFIECIKEGIILRGITHDLSKFTPSEFSAYANYFFNEDGSRKSVSKNNIPEVDPFFKALNSHQLYNDHHWQYWVQYVSGSIIISHMSLDAMKEMICDWKGAGIAMGNGGIDNPLLWYKRNRHKMLLHTMTKSYIEYKIGYVFYEGEND